MRIRLLGPVEVVDGDLAVALGGAKERVVLAALALNAGEVVSTARLEDILWGDEPPRTATATLRSHVSRLRRALAPGGITIDTSAGGLALRCEPEAIDVQAVEQLLAEARESTCPDVASRALRAALGHWRGPSLGDLADLPFAASDAARLDELRLSILEQRVTADLACGRHREVAPELEALCAAHPYRETLWSARMLALYRSGRQAEALGVYSQLREALVEDLGIDPSPRLRQLEAEILAQSPALEWRGDSPSPPDRAAAHRLPPRLARPLVGRIREQAAIEASWRQALAGAPGILLISGEPGIGKSRLGFHAAQLAESEGGIAVYGRADEQVARPYGPVAEALERLVATVPPHVADAVMAEAGAELATLVPALRSSATDAGRVVELSERDAVFEAVVRMLGIVTRHAPLLVVLDDLHWAGAETFHLLQYVLRSPTTARVMAVVTYRDTEAGPDHPVTALQAFDDVTSLRLTGLDEPEIATLIDEPQLAARIHRDSGGNPFIALELATHAETAPDVGELPRTVSDLLGRRFRALGTVGHQVLRFAAVAGREFPVRLLEAALDLDDPDAVLDRLDAAVQARLVEDLGGGRMTFAHDLVRAALLRELTSARRARMHRRIAEVLRDLPETEQDVAELAHHSAEAVADGLPLRLAVDAALRHARDGVEQLAPERALDAIDRALAIVGASVRPDRTLRCELLLARADVLEFAGERTELRELALRAAEDARAVGCAQQLARCARRHYGWGEVGAHDRATVGLCEEALAGLAPDDHRWRAIVLAVLAQVYGNGEARLDDAIRLAEDAVGVARTAGDPEALLFCLPALDRCRLGHPDVRARLAVNEELIDLATRMGDAAARFAGIRQQAAAHLELGNIAGFDAERRAMERLQPELGSWISRFWTRAYGITHATLAGRFDDAQREINILGDDLANETNAVTMWAGMQTMLQREQGRMLEVVPTLDGAAAMFPSLAIFPVGAVALLAEGGRLDDAAPRYAALMADEVAAVPRDQTLLACVAGLTEACTRLGDAAGARRLRTLAEPFGGLVVTTGAATFCFGTADRFIGMLFFVEHELDRAVEELERALELELAMEALPFAARTRRWLGEALLARGRAADRRAAELELEEALCEARRLGMPALEAEILPLHAGRAGEASVPLR